MEGLQSVLLGCFAIGPAAVYALYAWGKIRGGRLNAQPYNSEKE